MFAGSGSTSSPAVKRSPIKRLTNIFSYCENWVKSSGKIKSYWSNVPAAPNNAGDFITGAEGELGEPKVIIGVDVSTSVNVVKNFKENETGADEDKSGSVDQSDQSRAETAELDDKDEKGSTNSDGDDLNVTLGFADSPDAGLVADDFIDGATPSKRIKLDPSYLIETEQIMIPENESPMQSLITIESVPENESPMLSLITIESAPENESSMQSLIKIESVPENESPMQTLIKIESVPENESPMQSLRKIESVPENEIPMQSLRKIESVPENEIPMQTLIKIESEDECTIIQESFSSRRIKYFPPRAVYDCDVCCFSKFKTENERVQHLMKQAQRTSWECEICSESFSRPMELHRHKISFHQSRKRTIRSRLIELV